MFFLIYFFFLIISFFLGSTDHNFYFVEKGTIKVEIESGFTDIFNEKENKRQIPTFIGKIKSELGIIKEGETFGETNFLLNATNVANLIAKTDVTLCIVEGFFLDSVIRNNPLMSIKYFRFIAYKLADKFKKSDFHAFSLISTTLKISRIQESESN